MKRTEKSFFVQNLTAELKSAKSVILINFAGMSVKAQQELKKRLKAVGGRMVVVKNTLFKRAGKEAKIAEQTLQDSVLTGQTALILADEDPIAPLQAIGKFALEFEVPHLKVGIVEGIFQGTEALDKISKLPSKEILLAQTVGTIGQPLYAIVGTLQANLQKLIYMLDEKSKIKN